MKKIYVKYKVLVNGFNPIGKYKVDEFTLKTGKISKKYFEEKHNISEEGMSWIDFNPYIFFCLCDYENLLYRYFENDDFIEFEVSNKTNINNENVTDVLKKYPLIHNKIYDLEKKMRIIFNIPILFQNITIEFYDEYQKYICCIYENKSLSTWNRLKYNIDPEELSNNSRFGFDYNSMKNINNNNFCRALTFFDESFKSEKIEIRYILLFSCLESIFNLDGTDITAKLAKYSAKLLAEEDLNIYNQILEDIKKLYDKRCNYVHGSKMDIISAEDERILRRYIRKIIIAYWIIISTTKKSAKQILDYLDTDEKLDITVRALICSLNSDSFSSQQHKLLSLVENEFKIKISDNVKNEILKYCDSDNQNY